MNNWIGRDSYGEFFWCCDGHVHTAYDERYVSDEFGNAVEVPFSGEPYYFQEH